MISNVSAFFPSCYFLRGIGNFFIDIIGYNSQHNYFIGTLIVILSVAKNLNEIEKL